MNDMPDNKLNAPASAKRRPIAITVTILSDKGSGEFDIDSKHVPIKKQPGAPDHSLVSFNNWQDGEYSDGFTVTFELVDTTGKQYGFHQDPKKPCPHDALSVRAEGASGHCPEDGECWAGFTPICVDKPRKKLTVENPNNHLQYFGFALHFSRDGEAKHSLTFDPIGDNQNGNARLNFS
jgi:hypothetical protein